MLSLVPRDCARPPCINAANKRPIPLGFLTPRVWRNEHRIDRIRFHQHGPSTGHRPRPTRRHISAPTERGCNDAPLFVWGCALSLSVLMLCAIGSYTVANRPVAVLVAAVFSVLGLRV